MEKKKPQKAKTRFAVYAEGGKFVKVIGAHSNRQALFLAEKILDINLGKYAFAIPLTEAAGLAVDQGYITEEDIKKIQARSAKTKPEKPQKPKQLTFGFFK